MARKRTAKVSPIKPKNGEKPKNGGKPKDVVIQPPETHTFLVDGRMLQATVETLAGLQLTHPASVQRDQLVSYYTSLKSIESIGKSNDSG